MSLISSSNDWLQSRTVLAWWRCSSVRSLSSNSPVIPMTPFIGVRISWLILARNSLLATVAVSASIASPLARKVSLRSWRLAASNVSPYCFNAVISQLVRIIRTALPVANPFLMYVRGTDSVFRIDALALQLPHEKIVSPLAIEERLESRRPTAADSSTPAPTRIRVSRSPSDTINLPMFLLDEMEI